MKMPSLILLEKERVPVPMQLLAGIIIYLGSYLLFTYSPAQFPFYLGPLLILVAIGLLTLQLRRYYQGQGHQLVNEWRLLGFTNRQNQPLPEVQYLALVPRRTTQPLNYKSISITSQRNGCSIHLITRSGRPLYIRLCTCDTTKALELGTHLGQAMHTQVLDSTQKENVWLNTTE